MENLILSLFPETTVKIEAPVQKAEAMTEAQLHAYVKENGITTVLTSMGEKKRLFIATNGLLCCFNKGSNRRGFRFYMSDFSKIIPNKEKTEVGQDEKTYRMIKKFRDQALKAHFTNSFIRQCIELPATFEKWVQEGKKDAYEYSITTGCKITGDLISVKSICKKIGGYDEQMIPKAIESLTPASSCTFDFNGYDGSLSLEKKEDGTFCGYLSKEYKGTGNGYYYLLINKDWFIGYDVD